MTPRQQPQSAKYNKTLNILRNIVLFEKWNSADLGQGKRNRFPLFIFKSWSIIYAIQGMKMTSQTLFYADISVKLFKYNNTRKVVDDGICRSSPNPWSQSIRKTYTPPKTVSRFPGLLAIKRQRTLEIKFHYFTDDRLEISSSDVLECQITHPYTERSAHWCWGKLG